MRSLNIAATGMLAQQRNVEVVSNNLANMNTTGYMRRRTEFHDLLYQNLRRVGSTSNGLRGRMVTFRPRHEHCWTRVLGQVSGGLSAAGWWKWQLHQQQH